jgi:SAM-dependent methyltransferase
MTSALQTYWDRVAGEKAFTIPFEIDRFGYHVPRTANILDVGCGYGRVLGQLASAGFGTLTGVDGSARMIDRARRDYPRLNLFTSPAGALPFKDGVFDATLLIAVMTCIPTDTGQFGLMREIRRILRPGGIFYFSDFLLNSDHRNLDRYRRFHQTYDCYGVFQLPDGAVLRHHHPDHIRQITSGFRTLVFENRLFPTMNGHHSNGCYFIGKNG